MRKLYLAVASCVALAAFLVLLSPAVATADFNLLTSWGEYGAGNQMTDGAFNNPHGIAVGPDENVYVTDTGNRRVQKFDSSGGFLAKWGGTLCDVAEEGPDGCDGEFKSISGIAAGPDGSIYVVDHLNYRVQKFDSNGEFLGKWGSFCGVYWEGQNGCDGRFYIPIGIAVDRDGYVYVTDRLNHRIQKFSSNGDFIARWGRYCDVAQQGTDGCDGRFNNPAHIATGSDGNVYVTDSQNHRVQKFDSNGGFLAKWGSEGTRKKGKLYHPVGIAVDWKGRVYVADQANHRIQRFTSTGAFRGKWGGRCIVAELGIDGCDGMFNFPYGIAIDRDKNIYVADTFNHRIQKFGKPPDSDDDADDDSDEDSGEEDGKTVMKPISGKKKTVKR